MAYNGSHNSNEGQIHWFGGFADDVFNIGLNNLNRFGNFRHDSHHIYSSGGTDTYNFVDFASLGNMTSGRLDDFDPERSILQIEGSTIDIFNLPNAINGVELSVVEFNGQQWLRMRASDGDAALFALEGARLSENVIEDVNRVDRGGGEERHFVNISLNTINALQTVEYENPNNLVPFGLYESRESSLDELHANSANFSGSNASELIYGVKFGSGSDRSSQVINAGGGDDVVNARSGNDTVYGGSGDDLLAGGLDNDYLYGGTGNDTIFGGTERDYLFGELGRDVLDGGRDNDVLDGGPGGDRMTGGEGEDIFVFGGGDLVRWGQTSGSWENRNSQLDVITDFEIGTDLIKFEASSGVDGLADLAAWKTTISGDVHFTILIRETHERVLVNVEDDVQWSEIFNADNFVFGDTTAVITDADMHAWGALNGDAAAKIRQLTVVEDFDIGVDKIRFTQTTGIDNLGDLSIWKTMVDGNQHFTIRKDATNERILVDVAENVTWGQIHDADNFIFG